MSSGIKSAHDAATHDWGFILNVPWEHKTDTEREILWAQQDDLETQALDQGIRRFREELRRQPASQWPASRQLIAAALAEMVDGIEQARMLVERGGGAKGCQGWGIPFLVMDPNALALAALSTVLDRCASGQSPTATALLAAVGRRCEMEFQFLLLKEDAPRLKAVMERRLKRGWNARNLRRAMTTLGDDYLKAWDRRTRLRVGMKMLEILVERSGMFHFIKRRERGKAHAMYHVEMLPGTVEAIDELHEALEIMTPVFAPTVVPPNPWSAEDRGGYRILRQYTPFIIPPSMAGAPVTVDHSEAVYAAVNIVQATPWRINTDVMRVMKQVWKAGGGIAKLPPASDIVNPAPYPLYGTEDQQVEWKKDAAGIHQRNARAVGKRLMFLQTIGIAEQFKDETFYFPHRCDFRGRIYPIPQFLQPQGNDVARGLLTFAEKKPLGERGLYWLRVQYANCWGIDKVSFGSRVTWANEKLDEFCAFHWRAQKLEDLWEWKHLWLEADKPWQALATLLEIGQACMLDNPAEYQSSLPVSMDGSNSGLQHLSAMLLDEEGGKLVNLTPAEQPSDIYTDVADWVRDAVYEDSRSVLVTEADAGALRIAGPKAVEKMLEKDGKIDTTILTLPHDWLKAGIDRGLCKRPTMTYCYGVTQQGLKDALISDGYLDWADNQYAACQYIGKKIWGGIQANITGASRAMDWLREVAGVANKAGQLIEWHTPVGFHVNTPYIDARTTRISCLSAELTFRVYDSEAGPRPYKQRNSLPPNFVHSMDAAHLMMTVLAGSANGINSWMMIHDSFGTHACDVDNLNQTLREEFVKLYSIDVFARLKSQVEHQTGLPVPAPPEKGQLRLEEVHDSPYFFA